MGFLNRAVTAAICLLGGLAIGVFGLASLRPVREVATDVSAEEGPSSGGVTRHRLSPSTSNAIALRTLELSTARKRVAQLRDQLKEQTTALGAARRELQNLAAQNEKLRSQRNESLEWLLSLLSEDVMPPEPPDATNILNDPSLTSAPGANGDSTGSGFDANLDGEQFQRLLELENLDSELELSRALLAEAQVARQLERVAADADLEQLEESAAELFSRIGADALPALIDGLEDADAETRRLSARTLRAFGASAQGAIPALTMALADPNLRVREEAARALQAIGD